MIPWARNLWCGHASASTWLGEVRCRKIKGHVWRHRNGDVVWTSKHPGMSVR